VVSTNSGVIKQWCHQTVVSTNSGVNKQWCPQTVVSTNSGVIKQWCHQTVVSTKSGVNKQKCHQTVVLTNSGVIKQWCQQTSPTSCIFLNLNKYSRYIFSTNQNLACPSRPNWQKWSNRMCHDILWSTKWNYNKYKVGALNNTQQWTQIHMYLRTLLQSIFRKVSLCQWTICTSLCARTCISTQCATWAQGQCLCCSLCSSVHRISMQPHIHKHNKCANKWQRLLKHKNKCTTHHKPKMLYAHNTYTHKSLII
jgi:hypothetical protein